MRVKGVPLSQLETLAKLAQVTLYNVRTAGRYVSFVLRPLPGPATARAWGRISASPFGKQRRVWAVCYHGHFAFMDLLFREFPGARLVTAHAIYNTRAEFIDKAPGVGYKNIGAAIYPVAMAEACECPESGTVTRPTWN